MAAKRVEPRARGRPPNGAQGAKRALLVAVNHYGNPQNDLPSCLKDAAQFKSVLQSHYGFESITELYDADATATKVDAGLGWLLQDATEADRLVFFYSGHGYQQPRNGNLEECLVLGNLDFYFDDRLSRLSQSAPAGVLTVVLDSCFSGGMDKRILLGDRIEVARTKLWVPPPDASQGKAFAAGPLVPRPFGCFPVKGQDAVKRLVLGSELEPGAKAVQPAAAAGDEAGQLQLNALLLSACSENETASAATSTTKGMSAFTFALTNTIPASGEIAATKLHDDVRERLAGMGFRQTPLLRAPARPTGMSDRSFVTLLPLTAASPAAGNTGKAMQVSTGSHLSATDETEETATMTNQTTTNQQNFDQQFWHTVERVAAQVTQAAGNGAAPGRKDFAAAVQPATSAQPTTSGAANGADEGQMPPASGSATLPARPAPDGSRPGQVGQPSGANGGADESANGSADSVASAAPDQAASRADSNPPGQQKWIGAALSLVGTLAPMVIDAIRKRRKDFIPDGEVDEEKLLGTVTEVVAPAVIDAIQRSPKDFTPDDAADQNGADDDSKAFPWGSIARVVASAVPSIIGEVTRGKDFAPELSDQAPTDDKGPGMIVGAVTPGIIEAIARRQQGKAGSANGEQGPAGDDKSIPWGAMARVAAAVVPAVVGEITHKKIMAPGMPPLPAPGRQPVPFGAVN